MIHAVYRPRAPLDRLVDFSWISDEDYVAQSPHRLAGLSPRAYLAARGEIPNHVPLRG